MSEKIATNIGNLHEHAIYYPTRTVQIIGEIDDTMFERTVSNLHVLDQTTGTVTVVMSSEGGCVYNGFGIYDAIKAMKNYVRIITYGEVSSMATVIMQAGDDRLMTPNSFLMLHEGETSLSGKRKDIKQWKRIQDILDVRCYEIYHTKVKERKRISMAKLVEKIEGSDWILTAEEALKWGLADQIVETY